MCLYGRPSHLVPYRIVQMPGEDRVTLMTEGYQSSSEVWGNQLLKVDQIVSILKALAGVIETCSYWLLSMDRVDLTWSHIWISKESEVCFTYHPFTDHTSDDLENKLRCFIKQLNTRMDEYDETAIQLMYRAGMILRDEPIQMIRFSQELKRILEGWDERF